MGQSGRVWQIHGDGLFTPWDEQDVQALLKLQTGSEVEIDGRVDGVMVRKALVLSPAELVR